MNRILALLGIAAISLASCAGIAGAQTTNDGVCQPQDQHVDGGGATSIGLAAPEGMVIEGYCVKAGSAVQGLGPEYVYLDPPVKQLTITHSSGKAISHYVLYLVPDPDVPVTTAASTTTVFVPPTSVTTIVNVPPPTPTWRPGEEPPGCGSACPEPDLPPETTMSPAPLPDGRLPVTGISEGTAAVALLVLVAGLALLAVSRSRSE